MTINQHDRDVLRTLASRYMEYATSDKNNQKRELWKALNRLDMQKPMVTIEQMPWHELDVDGFLSCKVEDPYFRDVEWGLRMLIYKWEHLPADMVLNPYITINRVIHNTGFGIGTRCLAHNSTGQVQTHLFEDQLAEMEDVEKIKTPVLTPDYEREAEIWAAASDIFGGIAPLRWGGIQVHSGLWDQITFWKGVENCYMDLIDRPELIHAIVDRYTNAFLAQLDQINALGAYDNTSNMCHCGYTFSDGDRVLEDATSYDGWTYSMAQLFTSVSPAINEEFEVPYMSKIFRRFRSVYYGCCERLDDRLHVIDRMPNIRKISCSPWSDREHFAATLPKKYIMSNKPDPSYLAHATFDEELVRKDLRRTIAAAKENGLALELLLKDITTVKGDPRRLWRWSEIALEETTNAVL